MVRYQSFDCGLDFQPVNIQFGRCCNGLARVRTDVGLFSRKEFCVYGQAMFQIVNTSLRGLTKADGTQVSGNCHVVVMRRLGGSLQLRPRDEHIRFEGACALLDPVIYSAARVIGTVELVQLSHECSSTLQVRSCDIYL